LEVAGREREKRKNEREKMGGGWRNTWKVLETARNQVGTHLNLKKAVFRWEE